MLRSTRTKDSHARAIFGACVVVMGACASSTSRTDAALDAPIDGDTADIGRDAVSDVESRDTGRADASRPDDAAVSCGATTSSFPRFDRSCDVELDCAIATHQINCCGSMIATGINASELDRFLAAEQLCRAMYPACGCPTEPTRADDGRAALPPDEIAVRCVDHECRTWVVPRE